MTKINFLHLFLTSILFAILSTRCAEGQNLTEGAACTVRGKSGVCKKFPECPAAKADFQNSLPPVRCSKVFPPIVCCAQDVVVAPKPSQSVCPPHSSQHLKIKKDGRGKARDKCIDWLDLIVRCIDGPTFPGVPPPKIRKDECNHAGATFIRGGVSANAKEFPHQAALGYSPEPTKMFWDCGGSLISDQWVLTAGHCLWSRKGGDVVKVKLGTVNIDDTNPENIYDVIERVKYPTYIGTSKYDDIALLKLDRKVKFSERVIPACLNFEGISPNETIATGWGLTDQYDTSSNTKSLMKVSLQSFTQDECKYNHPKSSPKGALYDGIRDSQMCYGSKTESKDTCPGDSGGPLQALSKTVFCTYTIVGITSFGKGCGEVGLPGVYTKVSHYIDWIESKVWP